jgi:hypothetical protein
MQYFLGGGKIQTKSLTDETGFKGKSRYDESIRGLTEWRKRIWMHTSDAPTMDDLIQTFKEDWANDFGGDNLEDSAIRDEIIDVINRNTTPSDLSTNLKESMSVNGKVFSNREDRIIAQQEAEMAERYELDQDDLSKIEDEDLGLVANELNNINEGILTKEEIDKQAKEYDDYYNSLSDAEKELENKKLLYEKDNSSDSRTESKKNDEVESAKEARKQDGEKDGKSNEPRAEAEKQQLDKETGEGEVVGKDAVFLHAGMETKGVVIEELENGTLRIKGKDGTIYKKPKGDVGIAGSKEKFYEDVAGAKPNTQTGRIVTDPIVGGNKKKISEIIFDVTKNIKQRLFFSKTERGYAGTYNSGNSAVKIKYNGDLDVTAHEIGHSIDDLFGVLKDVVQNPTPTIEAELAKFSPFGSKPPKNHPNPKAYEMMEGFAEWVRAFLVNPNEAKIQAPELFDLYNTKVSEEYKKALTEFSNDIRRFMGSSSVDKVKANIRFEPKKNDSLISRILNSKETNSEFNMTWVDRLAENFLDPLQAFNKAFKFAMDEKGVDNVLPKDDPRIGARLLAGANTKFEDVLANGMRDGQNKVLLDNNGKVKNLNWLLEPLDNTDKTTIKQDMEDVMAYMVAERTVELSKKLGRESGLSGAGGGMIKDVDVAQQALDEFNNGDPNKLARIKEAAERYREFADDILKYMVEKGRLAQKIEDADGNLIGGYDYIKQNNLQYVAMNRIMETEPGREIELNTKGGRLGSKGEPINKVKGSSKEIDNVYLNLFDSLNKSMKEADRNEVLAAFRNMIIGNRKMHDGEPNRLSDIGVQGKQGDKNSVTIFIDGKPEHWIFQEDIYNAIKGLNEEGFKFHPVITAFPKTLRWTVTHFPVFAARNVVRDFQERILKSRVGSGVKELTGDKQDVSDVAFAGGLNAGHYLNSKENYYELLEQTMHDISKNKKFVLLDGDAFKKGWQSYKDLLSKSESINRVAEYRAAFKKAKNEGMDDYNASIYAAYQSRDLMDFALIGNQMKWINQVIPFSNAAVQGLRRSAIAGKENPKAFTAKLLAYTILPQMLLWMYNHKDDETAEEYEALPSHQKDLFWNFKIGTNKWASIPKPFELGLGGSFVDRLMSMGFYGNEKAFEGYLGSVGKSVIPIDQNVLIPIAPAVAENIMNYDLFRDKAIVPPAENNLNLAMRNTETASRAGQALQEVSGIDARKIDHFIKGQFSYYGSTALKLSDIGKENSKNKFGISDLGFFKETPAYNSKEVQDFMAYINEYGLNRSGYYQSFSRKAKEYFNAKTDEEKEVKARILRKYAKENLERLKESNMDERQKEKAEKKKERRNN